MPDEQLQWQKKEALGISPLVGQIENLAKEVVKQELISISTKLETLEKMGIVGDKAAIEKIKQQIEIIRNSNDFSIG